MPEGGRLRTVARETEGKKLLQLPLAALYALCALLCFVTFAAVYYPKMYAPLLLEKTRSKFIEWHVMEHAQTAQATIVQTASSAYVAASESQAYAKGTEYVTAGVSKASEAYTQAVSNPAVAQGLAKSTEAASTLRSKVSDELLKLRSASSLPVTAEAPGSGAV